MKPRPTHGTLLFCPTCREELLASSDGEWFTCPNRHVVDAAPEDVLHLEPFVPSSPKRDRRK